MEETNALEKSKSQRKREHLALQNLARTLIDMPAGQLAQVPLPAALAAAVDEARTMSRKALRRQIRFLAKLLSETEVAPAIQRAAAGFKRAHREDTATLKRLERWREKLLTQGDDALGELSVEFPHTDRQRVRALVRSARKRRGASATPKAERELFRYLRALEAAARDSENGASP